MQDLARAPVNGRGRVEYVATFALAKPIDRSKASGVLVYSVVNRGNGDAVPSAQGHVSTSPRARTPRRSASVRWARRRRSTRRFSLDQQEATLLSAAARIASA